MTASQDLITRIRDAANGRWAEIFATLGIAVGEGKHQPCPVCGGTDRFRFDDRDGRGTYFCNQCRPEAGDGFSLVQRVRGCPFLVAVNLVAQALGVSPVDKGPKQRKRRPIIRPGPPEGRLGVNLFEYPDGTGMPVIYVQRFERQDGEKFFVQWGRTSDGVGWQNNLDHAPYPRPLYRLNDLNATDPIVFHEGEKAVHAAIEANLPGNHTTTLGGRKMQSTPIARRLWDVTSSYVWTMTKTANTMVRALPSNAALRRRHPFDCSGYLTSRPKEM